MQAIRDSHWRITFGYRKSVFRPLYLILHIIQLSCIAIKELEATGHFEQMSLSQDENEHSIEMHLPYVRKIFQG